MFIDTHCHILKDYYDDIDKVIKDDVEANVKKIIISGCDNASIIESLELSKKYNNVFVTIGYHPEEVLNVTDSDIKNLIKLVKENEKVVGIGEIGLDYHYGKDNWKEQIILFRKQLQIAQELNLPVVIHSRDAVQDTINCLKDYKVTGVIHCFSGSLEVANIYIKMGFKLGIGGVITFKNSKLGEVIKNISLENIVLETDSPYLAPTPYRGSVNSSKYIPVIAQCISDHVSLSLNEVEQITTNNAIKLFKV